MMLRVDECSDEDPGPLPGPRYLSIYYRYNFTTNTAKMRNFICMVSKLRIETVSHQSFPVALTLQGCNILRISKRYFTRKAPEFQSEIFLWNLNILIMRTDCIGLTLGPFGPSGPRARPKARKAFGLAPPFFCQSVLSSPDGKCLGMS